MNRYIKGIITPFYPDVLKKVCKACSNRKTVIIQLLLTTAMGATAQIKADFSADVTSGCSPMNVAFTNLSVFPEGTTFLWDLGNGNTSTAVNPQATYSATGTYTIKLTISANGQTDVSVRENLIQVHANPTALFSLNGTGEGCSPFATSFTNNSHDAEGAALSYIWSFGDGSKSSDTNPSHTYQGGGKFDVTLMATNEFGCIAAVTQEALTTVYKPVAKFGVDKSYSCSGSLETQFNNLCEGGPNLSFQWQFGDGNTSTDNSPTHLYGTTGTYTVQLTATHPFGCSSTTATDNLINIILTKADFSVSKDTICPGQTITVSSTSQNTNRYTWKFGDGTSDRFPTASKTYPNAGDYKVWLIASNGICTDSISKNVNVELVTANFAPADSFICQLPNTLKYVDLSTNAAEWEWVLGNGETFNVQNPTANYTNKIALTNDKAVFDDKLTVTSKHGCKSQYTRKNSVTVHIPTVKFSSGTQSLAGCIPMAFNFSDQTVYAPLCDSIVKRTWQFNNGAQTASNQFAATVTKAGTYPIALTLTSQKGCVFTTTKSISAGEPVTPDFKLKGAAEVCASVPVDFEITSPASSRIHSTSWDFGDGDENAGPMALPPHWYIKTGQMDVTLTVFNFGCPSKVTKSKMVNILGPHAKVTSTTDCANPYHTPFKATVIDASGYQWNFGDDSPIESQTLTPEHTYLTKDKFNAVFTAFNATTGCSYSVNQPITIREPKAAITMSDSPPCAGQDIAFDAATSTDASPFVFNGEAKKYLWQHRETGKTIFANEPVTFSFPQKGTHHLSLIVKDEYGCADTATTAVQIYQPTSAFAATYKSGCMPVNYTFSDKSEASTPIAAWDWAFGDGGISNLQNPEHAFAAFGKYNISLEVTDNWGCKHKSTANQMIQAIEPDARFEADEPHICQGMAANFQTTSNSNIINYLWEFSDGFTSTLPKPSRTFNSQGNYSVTLSIVDDHDCHTSLTKTNYVQVQPYPKAEFKSDALASQCYPFVVQFSDLTQTDFPGTWKWDFGENNNQSDLQNPFFIYNRPGKHDVSLIAYTSFGCSDTLVKKDFINVGGPSGYINIKDSVCKNADLLFSVGNATNVYDVKWDFGDGYNAIGNNAPHRYPNGGYVYPAMFLRSDAQNTCNKVVVDTLYILDQKALYTMDNGPDGGCVPFNAQFTNHSAQATSHLWNFGDGQNSNEKDPVHRYESTGSYPVTLTVSHTLGCTESFSAGNVEVFPLPVIATSPDTTICAGTQAWLRAEGGHQYLWTPSALAENPQSAYTKASPSSNTRFKIEATTLHGCSDSAFVNVWVQHPIEIVMRDTTVIIGESVTVDVFNPAVETYAWEPAQSVSCPTCHSTVLFPLDDTRYVVSATDTTGCFTGQFPIQVAVEKKYSIELPSAFTPNGDGINDKIYVQGWGIKELVYFRVFNRLGHIVYDSNDKDNGWDGTFNNSEQPIETYSFSVVAKTYGGTTLSKNGTFKLIR